MMIYWALMILIIPVIEEEHEINKHVLSMNEKISRLDGGDVQSATQWGYGKMLVRQSYVQKVIFIHLNDMFGGVSFARRDVKG